MWCEWAFPYFSSCSGSKTRGLFGTRSNTPSKGAWFAGSRFAGSFSLGVKGGNSRSLRITTTRCSPFVSVAMKSKQSPNGAKLVVFSCPATYAYAPRRPVVIGEVAGGDLFVMVWGCSWIAKGTRVHGQTTPVNVGIVSSGVSLFKTPSSNGAPRGPC